MHVINSSSSYTISFYHDNAQLTFYKCGCEYTCISA